MKILRIASDLYPSVVGGLGVHAHEMSKLQAELGHDVTVYASDSEDAKATEYRDGYKICRFNGFKILGNSISWRLILRLFKERDDFDIIHAHSHLFFSTDISALMRKISSTPLVITNHGLISQTAPMWLQKIFIPTIAKWTFRSADRIICYTPEEKAALIRIGIDPEKISIIHNGINTSTFSGSCDHASREILWIGRFTPGKGVEYLIEGFEIFLKEHPDFRLLMIGKGPGKDEINKMIQEMGLSGNIKIKDFVPNSDLPEVYQNSRLFVLPSLHEGVPRTILEAMASGLPIVCTELPQLVDIVNGCGLMVPVKDSDALAGALSRVVSDKILADKLGRCGRARVEKNFSWDDTVRQTLALYEEILPGNSGSVRPDKNVTKATDSRG